MFDAAECMFLYLESSLRVGSEEEGIEIDLPVQREAATGYPLFPASSLKGRCGQRARRSRLPSSCWACSAPRRRARNPPQPSSVVVSDAIPLFFPVRSLVGLFAWVDQPRDPVAFRRDVAATA